VSQPEGSTTQDEVRVSEYAGRVLHRWYIVLATVAVAVLLVVLNTVGGKTSTQGQATVFLGAPLTPQGGSTIPVSVTSNPTSAATFVKSEPVMAKASAASHIKAGALKSHTSVTVAQAGSTAAKAQAANANVNITVHGPWSKDQVKAAVQSLGDSLITWANAYQDDKAQLLQTQIDTDKRQIQVLTAAQRAAQVALLAIQHSSAAAADKATQSASLLATIADTGSRIDDISAQMTTNEIFHSAATTVEAAGYVQEPSAHTVTAASKRSNLLVAIFAGLIVGVILALLWDAMRRRPRAS
jgi:hypothetical protein